MMSPLSWTNPIPEGEEKGRGRGGSDGEGRGGGERGNVITVRAKQKNKTARKNNDILSFNA